MNNLNHLQNKFIHLNKEGSLISVNVAQKILSRMPNGLKTPNVRDISKNDHGSIRNLYNVNSIPRYKRSNLKFRLQKDQIPPLLLNNKLLRSLYRSNMNTSYFDTNSNEEYNSNKDNDSWDDTINEPDEINVVQDSPSYGRRESYDENNSDDSSDDNDSFDDIKKDTVLKLENWDMYDSINQIYLELGKSGKAQSKNSILGY